MILLSILCQSQKFDLLRQKHVCLVKIGLDKILDTAKTMSQQASITYIRNRPGIVLEVQPQVIARTVNYIIARNGLIVAGFLKAEEAIERLGEIVSASKPIKIKPELAWQVLDMKTWISSLSPGAKLYKRAWHFSPTRKFPRILHHGDSEGDNYKVVEEMRTYTKRKGRLVKQLRYRVVDPWGGIIKMPKNQEDVIDLILRSS